MVLVNGSEGIGTGWSSYIPNYNPRELVANLKHLLNGEPTHPMDPWYKGFKVMFLQPFSYLSTFIFLLSASFHIKPRGMSITKQGVIEKSTTKEGGVGYNVSGMIEEDDETTLRVTELPIRRWTEDYKEFLESMMTGGEKIKEPFIKVKGLLTNSFCVFYIS